MWKLKFTISSFVFFFSQISFGQLENSKTILAQNKVKSQLEKTCIGSCSAIYTEYDLRGNLIYYDFYRTGTIYKTIYDQEDNEIMFLYIDKMDESKIDTFFPETFKDELVLNEKQYRTIRSNQGKLIIKSSDNEKIRLKYNEQKLLVEEKRFIDNELVYENYIQYDTLSRVIENIIINKKSLENLNKIRKPKVPTLALIDRYTYNSKGQIIELYTYFADPCMGLNNHYLYHYNYHDNGLLESAEVLEKGKEFAFSLEYQYEFYD